MLPIRNISTISVLKDDLSERQGGLTRSLAKKGTTERCPNLESGHDAILFPKIEFFRSFLQICN